MTEFDEQQSVAGKRIAFVGKLGSMNRRDAFRLLRQSQAIPSDSVEDVDIVVVGADEIPLSDDSLLTENVRHAAARGEIEILNETELWDRIGLLESQQNVRRLYTPAMLAELLGVPVSVIRRWHHRGLIVPSREVHRLPYFDFQEIATARRLAELLAAGASPKAIEKKLEQLSRLVPGVERPLAQLSVIVEGSQLLLRQGEGLIEPDGQMRLDFEAEAAPSSGETLPSDSAASNVIKIQGVLSNESTPTPEEMIQLAGALEDDGQFVGAAEMYRAALMASGLDAGICFRLAELLYLTGDLAGARERYSMTIELDPDFVEARSGLGCLFKELGDLELAVAAFRGAIQNHPDYPDAHYHLARTLTELNELEEANEHWRMFLSLAPNSPWAEEARQELGVETITEDSKNNSEIADGHPSESLPT